MLVGKSIVKDDGSCKGLLFFSSCSSDIPCPIGALRVQVSSVSWIYRQPDSVKIGSVSPMIMKNMIVITQKKKKKKNGHTISLYIIVNTYF